MMLAEVRRLLLGAGFRGRLLGRFGFLVFGFWRLFHSLNVLHEVNHFKKLLVHGKP